MTCSFMQAWWYACSGRWTLCFPGCSFSSIYRRHQLVADIPSCSFDSNTRPASSSDMFPWAWATGVEGQMYHISWGWATQSQLSSVFWPVVAWLIIVIYLCLSFYYIFFTLLSQIPFSAIVFCLLSSETLVAIILTIWGFAIYCAEW